MTRVGLLLAVLLFSNPVNAQQFCGPRETVLSRLLLIYQEIPVAIGLTNLGNIIELARSDDGTWTLLQTTPAGVTCVISAGEYWRNIKPVRPGERS